ILLAFGLLSIFLTIVGLPGLWLMIAGHVGYGWVTGWGAYVGWPSTIALIVLAGMAEVVEFLAGAAGSRAAGGRKRSMIGAIIGGLVGAVVFSIPVPVIGTIIGVCLGTFLGAAIAEYFDRDTAHSVRVGFGAAKGRLWGIVSKLVFGAVMFIITLIWALPIASKAPASMPGGITPVLPPTTTPATPPSTVQVMPVPATQP
ncbi:MAG: DUF456 family protein, partial [Tepidisphaeraceae bacterium]